MLALDEVAVDCVAVVLGTVVVILDTNVEDAVKLVTVEEILDEVDFAELEEVGFGAAVVKARQPMRTGISSLIGNFRLLCCSRIEDSGKSMVP